jgi:hypothetical protein
MNRNKVENKEQKRQLHGIRLNRETIKILNDPAILGLARGGDVDSDFSLYWPGCIMTTSGISERPPC